jgi:hypothetical protein
LVYENSGLQWIFLGQKLKEDGRRDEIGRKHHSEESEAEKA